MPKPLALGNTHDDAVQYVHLQICVEKTRFSSLSLFFSGLKFPKFHGKLAIKLKNIQLQPLTFDFVLDFVHLKVQVENTFTVREKKSISNVAVSDQTA